MGPYWAVVSARFRMYLQYRSAAMAGVVCQMFWGLIRVMIFAAFYRSTTQTQPMSYREVVDYIWLGQALLLVLPGFYADTEVAPMVRSGTVAYELLRPVDLYWFWYARLLGARAASVTLRAAPQFVLAGLFLGLRPPESPAAAMGFAVAAGMALLLACALAAISIISTMWHVSGDGVWQLMPVVVFLCSGAVIPLPFFPDWAQPILNALPFRGLMDLPFRLYMGHIPPSAAVGPLAAEAAWVLGLVAFGRWLLGRGQRKLVVQGG